MLSLFDTIPTEQDIDEVCSVLRTGKLVMGHHQEALENELATYLGAGDVVTCGSGTDALTLCLETIRPIRHGFVIVPAMTFSATYEAVVRAGLTPSVIDIDPETGTPSSLQYMREVVAYRPGEVAAIIVVHLYGHPVYDLREIKALCEQNKIALIEDCAQCFGATLDGKALGTWGDAAAFSFYPTKPLGGIGDGGAAWFPNKETADWARARRNHGRTKSGQMRPGYNSRLDETNAAVLRNRLSRFGRSLQCRRENDKYYHSRLEGLSLKRNGRGSPYVYPILVHNREEVRFRLADIGVETGIHYDHALSDLPYVRDECPNATWLARHQLSLPCHDGVTARWMDRICHAISGA